MFVYHYINTGPSREISPITHNIPIASCSLRNLHFSVLHTTHFDKRTTLPSTVFLT